MLRNFIANNMFLYRSRDCTCSDVWRYLRNTRFNSHKPDLWRYPKFYHNRYNHHTSRWRWVDFLINTRMNEINDLTPDVSKQPLLLIKRHGLLIIVACFCNVSDLSVMAQVYWTIHLMIEDKDNEVFQYFNSWLLGWVARYQWLEIEIILIIFQVKMKFIILWLS